MVELFGKSLPRHNYAAGVGVAQLVSETWILLTRIGTFTCIDYIMFDHAAIHDVNMAYK
jgi:hypothetical protein